MKRTQLIDILKNIKKSRVSFIAVFVFVTLSVAIFTGIGWSGKAILSNSIKEIEDQTTYSIQAIFPYGLEKKQIEALEELDEVTIAEGANASYQFFYVDGRKYLAKVNQITEKMNLFFDVEGTVPSSEGEIAVNIDWAKKHNVKIGDTIVFLHDDDNTTYFLKNILEKDAESLKNPVPKECGMKYLTTDTYTVTALLNSPTITATFGMANGSDPVTSTAADCQMYVTDDSVDMDAFTGYSMTYIYSSSLFGMDHESLDYKNNLSMLADKLDPIFQELANEKCERIKTSFSELMADQDKKLADGKKELDDGEKKLADGEKEYKKSQKDYEQGKKDLADGWAQIEEGKKLLEEGKKQLAEKEQEFADAKRKVDFGWWEYNTALAAYNVSLDTYETLKEYYYTYKSWYDQNKESPEVIYEKAGELLEQVDSALEPYKEDYPEVVQKFRDFYDKYKSGYYFENLVEFMEAVEAINGEIEHYIAVIRDELDYAKAELNDALYELNAAQAQIDEAEAALNSGREELEKKQAELDEAIRKAQEGEAELKDAQRQLRNGRKELDDSRKKLDDGWAEYNDGAEQIQEARDNFDKSYKDYGATLLNVDSNMSFTSLSLMVSVFPKLRYSLALIFVVVGLFVCFCSLCRIVHEQIIQIGTKKALGLSDREVTLGYLIFSGSAAFLGVIVGNILGTFAIEGAMMLAIREGFVYSIRKFHFAPLEALAIAAFEILAILLTTYFACRRVLKRNAINLLQGEQPPAGRTRFFEKSKSWQKLSLLSKTIVNNCLNDKRRVIATVTGIMGCTALIVSAFMFTRNIDSSLTYQFDRLQKFDTTVFLNAYEEDAPEEIAKILDAEGISHTLTHTMNGALKDAASGEMGVCTVYAQLEDNYSDLYTIIDVETGKPVENIEGAWVNEAFGLSLGLKPGDTLQFVDNTGNVYDFVVEGFMQNYLTIGRIYIGADEYKKVFKEDPVANAILLDRDTRSIEEINEMVGEVPGVTSINDTYLNSTLAFRVFSLASTAFVGVYVALAVVMALLVILNLLVMFVQEKKKELIVLLINGFSLGDAKKYIYSDTISLTIIGIIIGEGVGILLGFMSTKAMFTSFSIFVLRVDWLACLIGALSSALLAFLMSFIALKRIDGFELTDINK